MDSGERDRPGRPTVTAKRSKVSTERRRNQDSILTNENLSVVNVGQHVQALGLVARERLT